MNQIGTASIATIFVLFIWDIKRKIYKDKPANWKPLDCEMCMGFWFGIITTFKTESLHEIITFASETSILTIIFFNAIKRIAI